MRRSVTLISVAITAFSIVLVASVVYGLRVSAEAAAGKAQVQPVYAPSQPPAQLVVAAPLKSPRIEPRAAADIAAEFLGRDDAYSVRLATYTEITCYAVTFTSGDIVYVSLQGQVLGSVPAAFQLTSVDTRAKERDDRAGKGNDGSGHETGDEAEHEGGGED